MRDRSVDLPAFGMPSSPTSAIRRRSRRTHRSSPGSPGSDSRGARFRFERKALLPRPPRPPRASTRRSPVCSTSPSRSPVTSSRASVPGGTGITRSAPQRPVRLPEPPCRPRSARNSVWYRRGRSVFWCDTPSSTTPPPARQRPRRGRRAARAPRAGSSRSPAAITALDEDLDPIDEHGRPPRRRRSRPASGGRNDAHALPARAVILEADEPVRESEERMVLGEAHVLPGLPPRAVLAAG